MKGLFERFFRRHREITQIYEHLSEMAEIQRESITQMRESLQGVIQQQQQHADLIGQLLEQVNSTDPASISQVPSGDATLESLSEFYCVVLFTEARLPEKGYLPEKGAQVMLTKDKKLVPTPDVDLISTTCTTEELERLNLYSSYEKAVNAALPTLADCPDPGYSSEVVQYGVESEAEGRYRVWRIRG